MPYPMGDFQIHDRLMRYTSFVPRFYNFCKSYGFEAGRIMPSRAFCSDENQGYPTILIAKHFGTFPFDHGHVGGIVSTARHGPHAHHGQDLAIIQASHVGYDPEQQQFGSYRRLQVKHAPHSDSCGKICALLDWYRAEYRFATGNVAFSRLDGQKMIIIDNQLLDTTRSEGLFLRLECLIDGVAGQPPEPRHIFSTSKAYVIHPCFAANLPDDYFQDDKRIPIGPGLGADLFHFKRNISNTLEGHDQLEYNLGDSMPHIVTSGAPALSAARVNTQIEFDRTYRTIIKEAAYHGKNLAFIAGINIDISPGRGLLFPLTKFVPWAAYIQTRGGEQRIMEQAELVQALKDQSDQNPDRIELSRAISVMEKTPEIKVEAQDF